MKKITTLALAAIAFASTASAQDFTVSWSAPSVYVEGAAFDVKVLVRVGEQGAKIPSWVMEPSAFEIGGKAVSERSTGSVSLPAKSEVTLEFDLGKVLSAPGASFELRYAKDYSKKKPVSVTAYKPVAEGMNFLEAAESTLGGYLVHFETNRGNIVVELWPDVAPNHVRQMLDLTYRGFYDGILFHRVGPTFMVQGGNGATRTGPTARWEGGQAPRVNAEFNEKKHVRGVLSAARISGDINSATSQFFLMVRPNSGLDGQYTAYGSVVAGMDVVDKIANTPGTPIDQATVKPRQNQQILHARVLIPFGG